MKQKCRVNAEKLKVKKEADSDRMKLDYLINKLESVEKEIDREDYLMEQLLHPYTNPKGHTLSTTM